jgi:hypothetical protein
LLPVQQKESVLRPMNSRVNQEVGGLHITIISTEASDLEDLIEETAKELISILDPNSKSLQVVICWDESHSLTDQVQDASWTRFSELRRSLRKIREQPIFSLFLSTAGKFHLFSPDVHLESSYRIANFSLQLFSPITEVGFDEFAIKVNSTSGLSLAEVASTNHMAHFGRSL